MTPPAIHLTPLETDFEDDLVSHFNPTMGEPIAIKLLEPIIPKFITPWEEDCIVSDDTVEPPPAKKAKNKYVEYLSYLEEQQNNKSVLTKPVPPREIIEEGKIPKRPKG